jgi:uncharacterized protein YqgC (DUF456 family)
VTTALLLWLVATLAIVAGFAGTLLPVLPGAPLMFAGMALGEWLALRDVVRAGRVGIATGVGLVVGTVIKLALAFAMLGIFVAALFL